MYSAALYLKHNLEKKKIPIGKLPHQLAELFQLPFFCFVLDHSIKENKQEEQGKAIPHVFQARKNRSQGKMQIWMK